MSKQNPHHLFLYPSVCSSKIPAPPTTNTQTTLRNGYRYRNSLVVFIRLDAMLLWLTEFKHKNRQKHRQLKLCKAGDMSWPLISSAWIPHTYQSHLDTTLNCHGQCRGTHGWFNSFDWYWLLIDWLIDWLVVRVPISNTLHFMYLL